MKSDSKFHAGRMPFGHSSGLREFFGYGVCVGSQRENQGLEGTGVGRVVFGGIFRIVRCGTRGNGIMELWNRGMME